MSNSPEYAAPSSATSRIRLVLLATWAALTVMAVAFVAKIGSNCPNADEWEFVAALTGHEPLGPWLWAQHNEHRLPLPRLVYYCLFQLTHDFRTASMLQIALLSATSLGLMTLAARLRGRPYWTDIFFPVSLVHVGHWENLLIGYNICFAFILVLETAIGLVALYAKRETLFRSGVWAGVLMVLLCLCGGGGVVAAMPVAMWLVYLAFLVGKSSRMRAAILLAFAAFPVAYLAVYLQGYDRPGHHPEPGEGGIYVLVVAGKVLSMAFGYGTYRWWIPIVAGMFVLGAATLTVLLRDTRFKDKRSASLGLIAIMAGIVAVALVIGMGRAGLDPRYGLASRYTYLVWPLLALTYLIWTQRGGQYGKWITVTLGVAAALAFNPNVFTGVVRGLSVRSVLSVVEQEAREGIPPEQIVLHFHTEKGDPFQQGQEERAIRAIPMLREAGVGAFAEGRR